MSETGPDKKGITTAPNLLIVDDCELMRLIVKRVIELSDMRVGTVHEAANGEEALSILHRHPVQVLLTDLNMPVMTGRELLQRLSGHLDGRIQEQARGTGDVGGHALHRQALQPGGDPCPAHPTPLTSWCRPRRARC
jgi:CheY-like chemotaxis protein